MAISHDVDANGVLDEQLSEMLTAASKIDGLDIELALSRISGKQNVLEDCIIQTADSMDEKLRIMSSSLSTGNLRGFSIEAHGLKVAFAGIGAVKHSELAAKLEINSKAGNAPICKKEFIVFAGMAKELIKELKSVFPQKTIEKKQKGDSKFLFQAAKETSEYLDIFETDDALDCIKKLENLTFGAEMDDLLERIKNRIKAYKYDEAKLLLESVLKQI